MNGNLFEQLISYYQTNSGYLFELFINHFLMSVYGVLFASIIGIPLGIIIARFGKIIRRYHYFSEYHTDCSCHCDVSDAYVSNRIRHQYGYFYSILVCFTSNYKNTYTGIKEVDINIKDAGKGMGMTRNQVLRMIELPLSLSVIIGGIRIALVVAIGVVAVGSFIGAPSLGDVVIRGTNATDGTLFILAGALPIVVIVVLIDIVLRLVEKKLDPATQTNN